MVVWSMVVSTVQLTPGIIIITQLNQVVLKILHAEVTYSMCLGIWNENSDILAVSFLQLFGTIEIGSVDDITPTTAITTYNNFANFPQAALVMIRLPLHAILYPV